MQFRVVIYGDADAYTALCLDADVASEGATPEEAESNLIEALELYFEDEVDREAFGLTVRDISRSRLRDRFWLFAEQRRRRARLSTRYRDPQYRKKLERDQADLKQEITALEN